MKNNFTLIVCLVFAGFASNAQTIQWQKLLGGSGDDNFGYNIQQTADGGFVETGFTNSSNTGTLAGITNNGGNDGWIVKSNSGGATTLQKLFGGTGDDLLYGIQQTADGGYIVAGYSNSSNSGTLTGLTNNGANDGWIMKLDASGNIVWQKLLGGSNNDYLFWIRQTADGGYIAAGQSLSSNSGTLTGISNNGSLDGWVIKLDASGNTVWQKLLGGSDDDYFRGIEQTSDAGYIVTCGANSTNTGTLVGITGTAAGSAWVVKLDASGNTTWQKLFGGSGIDNFISVQQTIPDGGYIAVGYSNSPNDGTFTGLTNNGNMDGWVMKLDASGNITWQKLFGGVNDDLLTGIHQTSDGGYIAAGYALSSNSGTLTGKTSNGANDGWLIKLSATGFMQSQSLFGGTTQDFFQGINIANDGGYIISGYSNSSNTGTLTGVINNGGNDGWVVKISQFIFLPVILGDFSAQKMGDNNLLQWFTNSESNNKGFHIERSTGNSNSFIDIAFVSSKSTTGNSSSKLDYTFTDNSKEENIYYRLRQEDFDGRTTYSKIVWVKTDKHSTMFIGPNPASSFIKIQSVQIIDHIFCYDAKGQIVRTLSPASNSYQLQISDLPTGTYLLKIETAAGITNKFIVKQ